jgi:hypothetical protein
VTRLAASVLDAHALPAGLPQRMYALYAEHYEACDPQRFVLDLAGKDHVIVLEEGDALRGFSTLAHFHFESSRGPVQVVFSGDTLIDPEAWGEQALSRAFARLAGALQVRAAALPLYWLLISKGHRTYRYLSVFARRYFPHPDAEDPHLSELAAQLAAARFGAAYDASRGVVAHQASLGHLRHELAEVPTRIASRADGAFFLRRNPGYRLGHELVCLTELRPDNLRAVVRQAILEGQAHGLG